jgi:hypothetical protein
MCSFSSTPWAWAAVLVLHAAALGVVAAELLFSR